MVTCKTTKKVIDNKTVKYIYDEGLQTFEIHELFADQAAQFGQSTDFTTYDNLNFAKAILGRLPLIRDSQRRGNPPPETYYIKKLQEPEPEPEEEEDDDDCMITEIRPAANPRPTATGGPRVKKERSAAVEA
jgi:hypothetical protein